jgi:exodeoxyribonuclease VII small subunit
VPKKNDSESLGEQVMGYEQARDQLADIAAQLERGSLSLEESLALWEQGEKLADICEQWLTHARERVNPGDPEIDN